jgi:hypothetical protein
MKFFFPDSQDLVDPSFNFTTETRSDKRLRHRDDLYAHEVFPRPPFDGILVSRASVVGTGGESSRYTLAQRHRLLRVGVREFFRLGNRPLETMGDCGAFSYIREMQPPVTVEEVIDFYEHCGVDYGVSVDHVILAFQPDLDNPRSSASVPEEWKERQSITLKLAQDFLKRHRRQRARFKPIGVAQGWSPESYANAVRKLEKMGYRLIGLGGMVPLKSEEIVACLQAIAEVRNPETQFHLFGVTRCEHIGRFEKFGVVSFDSTSPLRQAFKDDRENYYAPDALYSAIRVPQVAGNPKLQRSIVSGEIVQEEARRLEQECLRALLRYDRAGRSTEMLLRLLREYDCVHDGRKDRTEDYRRTLEDRPWKTCPCVICQQLGIHVVIFRGAERNRRRGFHNLFVTYAKLHQRRNVKRQSAAPSYMGPPRCALTRRK